MMYSSTNSQTKSAFFTAPTEIRHAIYAYLLPDRTHLCLSDGKPWFSPCVQDEEDADPGCFRQRMHVTGCITNHFAANSDSLYAHRLMCSWGPHWRCEETATEMQNSRRMGGDAIPRALFLTCKRWLFEAAERVADTVIIHVNDIDTLGFVIAAALSGEIGPDRSVTSTVRTLIVQNLTSLDIGMRLSLSTYSAHATSETLSRTASLHSTFNSMPFAIERMTRLRRLRIWLDHDEPCSWSMVNERALLSPLAPLANLPSLQSSVSLPKLHPKWEAAGRHYTNASAPQPFAVHRRVRQRYHGIKSNDGTLGVEYKPDFPVLYEFAETDMTMEEVERLERRIWEAGDDPIDDIMAFTPACTMSI
ncbi:hypothetical protein FB567DRAFT_56509 [Paraphoma chrysanthemicola]|uniref:DUF7730 domain-containing protein n=1 Tax=Paraphoma chrysanthemicola TaxID=798071 RepID=A0A8K0R7Q2_9PLEO|nr:hypothetical protein FB567DRAFT_56509 [Paraphoma chrysanthemicola]